MNSSFSSRFPASVVVKPAEKFVSESSQSLVLNIVESDSVNVAVDESLC
jgi:hypothetical protein